MKFRLEPLKILDFDIEARPLGWYGGDFVHKEPTAIAWAWIENGQPGYVHYAALTKQGYTAKEMLTNFARAYAEADMVTGHWIRSFDLPILQTAMMEQGLPLIGPKLAHCTKSDLIQLGGISKSQENLGSMAGTTNPKMAMNQAKWRSGNRLEPLGIEEVVKRVIADVRQHVEMREWLMDRGLLRPPKVWYPGSTDRSGPYSP